MSCFFVFFFFQAEDGIPDVAVTGVQTFALPICATSRGPGCERRRRGTTGGAGLAPRRGQPVRRPRSHAGLVRARSAGTRRSVTSRAREPLDRGSTRATRRPDGAARQRSGG